MYSVVQKLGSGEFDVPVRNAVLHVRFLLGQLGVLRVESYRRQILQVAHSLVQLLQPLATQVDQQFQHSLRVLIKFSNGDTLARADWLFKQALAK